MREATPAQLAILNAPTEPQRWAGRTGPSLMDRLLAKRQIEGDCWIINGQPTQEYAVITILGDRFIGSRVMFYITHGRWPEGGVVRHTCDRKKCINPEHLIEGTHGDNVRDAVERGLRPGRPKETHCLRGHERTPENLTASRNCRICAADRSRAWRLTHAQA